MSERQSFYVGVKGVIRAEQGILVLHDVAHDKWELPGGRIDGMQSMEESFEREILEEIPGAKVQELGDILYAATGDYLVENEHRLLLVFRLADVSLPEVITMSDEHTEYAFVTEGTLPDYDFYASDQAAIERAFAL